LFWEMIAGSRLVDSASKLGSQNAESIHGVESARQSIPTKSQRKIKEEMMYTIRKKYMNDVWQAPVKKRTKNACEDNALGYQLPIPSIPP
jgi:hypothetical protein